MYGLGLIQLSHFCDKQHVLIPPIPLLVPRAEREDGCKDFGDYKLAPIIRANVMYWYGRAEQYCYKDHENSDVTTS